MKTNDQDVLEITPEGLVEMEDYALRASRPSTQGEEDRTSSSPLPARGGVIIGTLEGFSAESVPLVNFPGNLLKNLLPARTTVRLNQEHAGREVVLVFERQSSRKPIILGLLQQTPIEPVAPVNIEVDDERLELTARKEIVLRCGKASITLTRAGKVILRGAYLLNRSSGVNRIKGGSVQIN